MKRIIAIVLTLILAFSLFACQGNDKESTTKNDTESSESSSAQADSTSEESTSKAAADPSNLKSGDTGEGPAEIKTPLFEVKVPEGMNYSVNSYYIKEDNPLFGSITLFFKEGYNMPVRLVATTQNMVKSQEEAVERTISLLNLQDPSNATKGKDVKIGNYTFSTVTVKTQYYNNDYYVLYVNRGENDNDGLHIEFQVDNNNMKADDAKLAEILKSLSVVMEK